MNQSGNVRFRWVLNFRPFGALEFLFLATFRWDASQDFRDATGFAEGATCILPKGWTIHLIQETGRPKIKQNIDCGIYV